MRSRFDSGVLKVAAIFLTINLTILNLGTTARAGSGALLIPGEGIAYCNCNYCSNPMEHCAYQTCDFEDPKFAEAEDGECGATAAICWYINDQGYWVPSPHYCQNDGCGGCREVW